MEEYRQLFKYIDTDGDGKITLKKHCTAITKLQEISEINVDYVLMALAMFESFDEIPEFLQD
jgi:Ca2+-binding EF-hand superfamily protein